MVHPERFERPTLWFVAKCSIQLSYGCVLTNGNSLRIPEFGGSRNLNWERTRTGLGLGGDERKSTDGLYE